jgi:hypothetical protein
VRWHPLKHGHAVRGKMTPEYVAYREMKKRCYNPNWVRYDRYGGRGIKVCERWLNDFDTFFADMGQKPSPRHTLDRIDNDGDYTPENCRWATKAEQALNRRSTRIIEYDGRALSVTEWAAEVRMDADTLSARINAGWTPERALTTPLRASCRWHASQSTRQT